jgi:hypothetical protein
VKLPRVSLGEGVAVAAVVISGLGLYNTWGRTPTPAPTTAPTRKTPPLVLRATVAADGARLALSPVSAAKVVQSQTIAFPATLGLAPVETTGNPRIEAGWVDEALRKAADTGKAASDRRVPILITTRYIEGDAEKTDSAVYQLGYGLRAGGLLGGKRVALKGLSLVARGVTNGQARIDALWAGAHKDAVLQ